MASSLACITDCHSGSLSQTQPSPHRPNPYRRASSEFRECRYQPSPGPFLGLLLHFRVCCLLFPSFSQSGSLGPSLLLSTVSQGTHALCTHVGQLVQECCEFGNHSLVLGPRMPHSPTYFLGVPWTPLLETFLMCVRCVIIYYSYYSSSCLNCLKFCQSEPLLVGSMS